MRSSITGYKDTDLLVLERLDDKSLFSVMQTNKAYSELPDFFFAKRMKQKYPYLAVFKPEYQTWKYFYIHNSYYIGKLKEEYDLDYVSFPGPDCKPEKIYKDLSRRICINTVNYVDNNKERKAQKLRELRIQFISNVRKDFYIYQNKKNDLLELLDKYEDFRTETITKYLELGDQEFLDILNKKYPYEYEIVLKYNYKDQNINQAIRQLDYQFLDKNKDNINKYFISEAPKSGELEMIKYILSNMSETEKKHEYYKDQVGYAVTNATAWDDETLFKYLFDMVLSFKDPVLLKSIKRDIEQTLICAPYAKKYLKYF